MPRGFSLPGVMGASLLIFVLFLAFRNGLDQQRSRISEDKHRQSAFWLAMSGADLAEIRLRKKTMSVGESFASPSFPQGTFQVRIVHRDGRTLVLSKGSAGKQSFSLEREVSLP